MDFLESFLFLWLGQVLVGAVHLIDDALFFWSSPSIFHSSTACWIGTLYRFWSCFRNTTNVTSNDDQGTEKENCTLAIVVGKGLFLSQVIKEGDSKTIKVAFQIHLHHLLEGGPRNREKYWIVNFPVGSASTVQFLPFKPHLLAASQFLLLSSEVLSFLQIALDAHTGS